MQGNGFQKVSKNIQIAVLTFMYTIEQELKRKD